MERSSCLQVEEEQLCPGSVAEKTLHEAGVIWEDSIAWEMGSVLCWGWLNSAPHAPWADLSVFLSFTVHTCLEFWKHPWPWRMPEPAEVGKGQ